MKTEIQLRNSIIKRVMLMPKAKLIEMDKLAKNIEVKDDLYDAEFIEKVLAAFNEEGKELTPEYEKELFGESV